jgi:hypothetical protein
MYFLVEMFLSSHEGFHTLDNYLIFIKSYNKPVLVLSMCALFWNV